MSQVFPMKTAWLTACVLSTFTFVPSLLSGGHDPRPEARPCNLPGIGKDRHEGAKDRRVSRGGVPLLRPGGRRGPRGRTRVLHGLDRKGRRPGDDSSEEG